MTRIVLMLDESQANALEQLAKNEYRATWQQAAVIIRDVLHERGLLDTQSFPARVEPSPLGVTVQGGKHKTPKGKAKIMMTA